MKLRILSGLALFAAVFLLPTYAQNYRGAVRGRVTDPARRPIAGARVGLVQAETDERREAATGAAGEFAFPLLPPGRYRIEVEQGGYKKYAQDVSLEVNQELRADVGLEVGPLTEEILVTAPRAALRKDSPALGAVIDNRQVTGLPLDGRNFLDLSLLVPGAVPAAQGSAGSVRGDFAFNINGAREDANTFLLDGVYNVDPKLNSFGVKPPVDAVREFEVLGSTYDASFGRNAGAQVNVVLKSGTNQFHGTAYEFFRNRSLDARNFFAPADQGDPQYQRNQFGFSLGGPVVKDRLFFFGDYEGTRSREGITRATNVPTAAERAGNFSQSLLPKPIDPFSRQPFPGDQIPSFYLNPIGLRIAALYPLPNRAVPFQNYVASPAQRDRNDLFDARADYVVGPATSLAARYSFNDRNLFEPFTGPTFALIPGYGDTVLRRGQNAMVGVTHAFSPSFINDARFAYNRVAGRVLHENFGRSVNQEVGLPELSANPRDYGLSFISVTGYSPIGDEYNNPQQSVTNTYQWLDTATYARGRHLVKFGFDIRAAQQNAFRDVQSRGSITFSSLGPTGPAITGNALADLLIGVPLLTSGARLDNYQHLRAESYNFFASDSFRLRPDLTLTLGLRYEYNSPPVDTEDRANIYDPATRSLVRVGTNGVPRAGYNDDRNNLAPRVGLAWTLGGDGGTVLRAGYGVYYDQSALAPGEGLYFNAPYFDSRIYFTTDPQQPLTLYDPFPSASAFPFYSAFTFERDLRTAYVQHWNLGLQRQLGASQVLEVNYVGSKGTKLLLARDINQPRPSPQQPNPRPVPQFQDIISEESGANSSYHALQARLEQRLWRGLSLLGAYTWSKSLDNASGFFASAGDPNFPQDSYDLRAERGRSNFDIAHRFSLSYSYDLPFGRGRALLADRGWLSAVLAGWQTFGVVTLQSGRPFTVALLQDLDISNTGRSNLGFGNNDRPNVVGDPRLSRRTPERWFDTSAFAFQTFGTFGNAGRNILDGPGYENFNFSLLKNTALTEQVNLQFRAEFFNLFNHPNFDLPDNFLGSPTFGRIRSAQSPRHIQFGLKLLF